MTKLLMISDRPMLEDVYRVNLKSYLDIEMDCLSSLELALKALDHDAGIKAVLCHSDFSSGEALIQLARYKNEKAPNLFILALGRNKKIPTGVHVIDDPYDIKAVIKPLATFFNITAKNMALKEVPDLFPIPLRMLGALKKSPCEIYLNLEPNNPNAQYTLFARTNEALHALVSKQLATGLRTAFVPKEWRLKITNLATDELTESLKSEGASPEEKLEGLEQGLSAIGQFIGSEKVISEKMTELGSLCVKEMRSTVKNIPKLKELILALLTKKTSYAFLHTIVSAYVAEQVVQNISWGAKGQSEKIAFAFFFHDIFLVPILDRFPRIFSEDELLFSEQLSDKEKEIVLTHAKMAHDLVLNIPTAPVGAETIIIQHHGSRGGNDFASDYQDYLAPLSKVAILSHAFTELVLEEKKDNPENEINLTPILSELRERFPRTSYQKIIDVMIKIKF